MQSPPNLGKRGNAERKGNQELAGIDLGMNVKNMRNSSGRSGSKSFHVTSYKRQKTDLAYKAVSTEFNIQLGTR